MIGKTISHYKILEKLGEGGMGVVYKAEDTKLKRTVALKFLPHDLTRNDEAKERFVLEAQAASALDHPNICNIYEIDETEPAPGEPGGQLFIAMACYEGETLKQKLAEGPLSVDDAVETAIQVAQGLAKAHEKGIVHRDIKPANIMITNDGVVKILDFGLAKLSGATQLTKTGTTLGTLAYMSPEQAQGVEVDHRTDIWALGIILYEMLSGQHPFKGDYEQAVIYSILSEEPEPLSNLPAELEQIVQKALQKEPSERYQSSEELLSDLGAFKDGTKPAVTKAKPAISVRKRIYLYGGLAAFLLAVLISFFVFRPSKTPLSGKIRLAVLPFDNITQNPEDEYFADGMTDEMISKLSKIAGFGVIARTSVMQYKTAPKTIAEIGQELRVSKILEGSVRKAGNKLRITVQLIDVTTQEPIWSDDYDRELADVFAIQSEVAQQVASALRIELSPAEKRHIEKRGTESLQAYNLYLQGYYFHNKLTPQAVNKAIEYFNEAIRLDPEFAKAYAALARAYQSLGTFGYVAPRSTYPKAKQVALRALELDASLAEANVELATIERQFGWDWAAAETINKRAIELNPDYPRAHQSYALLLTFLGRNDEALSEVKEAQELDPLYLISHVNEGIILYHARRYDEAIEKLNNTIVLEHNYFFPYFWLGLSYLAKGMTEEAIAANQKCLALSGGFVPPVAVQGYILARAGNRTEAKTIIEQLKEQSRQRYVAPSLIALIYSALAENDEAFEWLEKAYEVRDSFLLYHQAGSYSDGLRSDPRFTALLKKMGLED